MFLLMEFYLLNVKRNEKKNHKSHHENWTMWGSLHSQGCRMAICDSDTAMGPCQCQYYLSVLCWRPAGIPCDTTPVSTLKLNLLQEGLVRFLNRFTSLHPLYCNVAVSASLCLRRENTWEAAPLSSSPLGAPCRPLNLSHGRYWVKDFANAGGVIWTALGRRTHRGNLELIVSRL